MAMEKGSKNGPKARLLYSFSKKRGSTSSHWSCLSQSTSLSPMALVGDRVPVQWYQDVEWRKNCTVREMDSTFKSQVQASNTTLSPPKFDLLARCRRVIKLAMGEEGKLKKVILCFFSSQESVAPQVHVIWTFHFSQRHYPIPMASGDRMPRPSVVVFFFAVLFPFLSDPFLLFRVRLSLLE